MPHCQREAGNEPPSQLPALSWDTCGASALSPLLTVPSANRLPPQSGVLSKVIIPKYDICDYRAVSELRLQRVMDVEYDGRRVPTRVWSGVVEGLPLIMIEPENGFFWRNT